MERTHFRIWFIVDFMKQTLENNVEIKLFFFISEQAFNYLITVVFFRGFLMDAHFRFFSFNIEIMKYVYIKKIYKNVR